LVLDLSFLGETQRQILLLLRRAPRTIQELAKALQLTDNAVRSHVLALVGDQLVAPSRRRPGLRKPSATYALTEAADQLFPKPYANVLGAMIGEVRARHGDDEVVVVLRGIGDQLARERMSQVAKLAGRERVGAIARIINDLGGLAEVEERDGQLEVRGYSCPLVAIVNDHPEVCKLTQSTIEGLLGQGTVQEACQRGDRIACRFKIAL
jgi:predicted ArsR family transcriptional regulator